MKFMHVEKERKYSVNNLDEIREACLTIGAVAKGEKETTDTYFQVPQETPRTRYLRLRTRDGQQATLAYFEVPDDLTTNEWEVEVDDRSMTQEILVKLGFPLDVAVTKHRETLLLDSCEIVLDQVTGLGDYVEIEAPDETVLDALAARLPIDRSKIITGAGYPDLLKMAQAAN